MKFLRYDKATGVEDELTEEEWRRIAFDSSVHNVNMAVHAGFHRNNCEYWTEPA